MNPLQDQEEVENTSKTIQILQEFQTKDHFLGDGLMYTGVQDARLKDYLNQNVAETAQQYIELFEKNAKPSKEELLHILKTGIAQINPDSLDTEDREQVAMTYEQFLDIVNLESSEGILNTWMYGEEINSLIENGFKQQP